MNTSNGRVYVPKNLREGDRYLAAAVFLLPPAFSQGKGGAATTPVGGGASSGTGATNATPSITTNPQPTTPNTSQSMPVPVPISGRVMLDDGGPPPETVVIERVCNGTRTRKAIPTTRATSRSISAWTRE